MRTTIIIDLNGIFHFSSDEVLRNGFQFVGADPVLKVALLRQELENGKSHYYICDLNLLKTAIRFSPTLTFYLKRNAEGFLEPRNASRMEAQLEQIPKLNGEFYLDAENLKARSTLTEDFLIAMKSNSPHLTFFDYQNSVYATSPVSKKTVDTIFNHLVIKRIFDDFRILKPNDIPQITFVLKSESKDRFVFFNSEYEILLTLNHKGEFLSIDSLKGLDYKKRSYLNLKVTTKAGFILKRVFFERNDPYDPFYLFVKNVDDRTIYRVPLTELYSSVRQSDTSVLHRPIATDLLGQRFVYEDKGKLVELSALQSKSKSFLSRCYSFLRAFLR